MDGSVPRIYKKAGTRWPPRCYIPELPPHGRKSAPLNQAAFLALLEDRGGLYGMNYETGIATGTISRWKHGDRIGLRMAQRLLDIYGVDVTDKSE